LAPCCSEDMLPFFRAHIRRHVFTDATRFQVSQDAVQNFTSVITKHGIAMSSFFHKLLKFANVKSSGLLLRTGFHVIRVAHRASIDNRDCADYPNWDDRGLKNRIRRGPARLLYEWALCKYPDQEVNEAPDLER
jgi:hypothetical protein